MKWFEVDREGLAKTLGHKSRAFVIHELVQNSLDAGADLIAIALERIPSSPYVRISIDDNAPTGFADLSHAYTLFAESGKKADPEKRGRFNLGEKWILAIARSAEIVSTTGTVIFDDDGRRTARGSRERGTLATFEVRMTDEEVADAIEGYNRVIPPDGVSITLNGVALLPRPIIASFSASLETVLADETGFLRSRYRSAKCTIHEPVDGRKGTIYEMGIPVVETGDRFDVNVLQRVPVGYDRDSLSPSYVKSIRSLVLNAVSDRLDENDARADWVQEAMGSPSVSDEAVLRVADLRFGTNRVAADPSDPEATRFAVSKGCTVVYGGSLSREAFRRLKEAGGIRPAGQVFPTSKPFSPNGTPLQEITDDLWSEPMRNFTEFVEWFRQAIMWDRPRRIRVAFVRDQDWNFAGAWSTKSGASELAVNLSVLDLEDREKVEEIVDFLIHEAAHHYSSNHLDHKYHEATTRLGARLSLVTWASGVSHDDAEPFFKFRRYYSDPEIFKVTEIASA